MKHLLIIVMAFALTVSVKAQDTSSHKTTHHQMKDCVMMKDGKMMAMKDGKTMNMTKDMKMSDGATVMPNGNLKKKDGTTVMLKEGDCVMMDGTVKHMDTKKKKDM